MNPVRIELALSDAILTRNEKEDEGMEKRGEEMKSPLVTKDTTNLFEKGNGMGWNLLREERRSEKERERRRLNYGRCR